MLNGAKEILSILVTIPKILKNAHIAARHTVRMEALLLEAVCIGLPNPTFREAVEDSCFWEWRWIERAGARHIPSESPLRWKEAVAESLCHLKAAGVDSPIPIVKGAAKLLLDTHVLNLRVSVAWKLETLVHYLAMAHVHGKITGTDADLLCKVFPQYSEIWTSMKLDAILVWISNSASALDK